MPYSQQNRLISLSTPLGEDKLLLTGLSGHEAISRMFQFNLSLISEAPSIDSSQIIGQKVTISVNRSDDTPRYFNGIVSHFAATGKDESFLNFEMQIVPWTWMLTRSADCRIFHNLTVKDILQKVFDKHGYTDFQFCLSGNYSPIEYCVQYRETDFSFVSRLMEQYGIFYFFQHSETLHTMVIADSSSVHQPCPGQKSACFNLASGGLDSGDVVNQWSIEQEIKTGKFSLSDYNFKTPSTSLLATETTIYSAGRNSSLEMFDYPGDFCTRPDSSAMAKLRMQEEEASHLIARGSSVCRSFNTGYKFDLEDYPDESMNKSYVLTEIQHMASVLGTYSGGDESNGGDTYSNHFTCIPESIIFRPARLTPKPYIQGPQTAVVVGKSSEQGDFSDEQSGGDGEEIWVDKFGRVLVLFPWDREKLCSCWVRVSQDWAGQGWGMINIPRVGQEVIVSFLEGDPDRPIITGRVYNAEQTVPYTLPDYGTRSTFKSRSTPKAGDDNYNELRFEDKKGVEQLFVRGEKDYDTRIKNDSREWIGNDCSLIVTKNQTESVGGDLQLQVTGNQVEKVGGDLNHHVAGNLNQKTDQTISIQAGENLYEKSGQNYAHEAGQMIHLKGGMTVVIEAGMQLSLKVGGNFIDIGPAGVTIQGTMVMINSGGSAGSGCGSSPTNPSDPKKPDEADDGSKGTKMN